MHVYHAIREKLRHQLRHPGRALDLKKKDLIGHLWVSLIIDQSECLVCFLFLHWINSFLHCFKKKTALLLNQSKWRIFFMYIIKWLYHKLNYHEVPRIVHTWWKFFPLNLPLPPKNKAASFEAMGVLPATIWENYSKKKKTNKQTNARASVPHSFPVILL